MASIFGGGGFTAPPGSQCKLVGQPGQAAQAVPQLQPQQPMGQPVQLGQAVPSLAPQQGFFQPRPLMGPAVYPVMKKGEAPCPVCRG